MRSRARASHPNQLASARLPAGIPAGRVSRDIRQEGGGALRPKRKHACVWSVRAASWRSRASRAVCRTCAGQPARPPRRAHVRARAHAAPCSANTIGRRTIEMAALEHGGELDMGAVKKEAGRVRASFLSVRNIDASTLVNAPTGKKEDMAQLRWKWAIAGAQCLFQPTIAPFFAFSCHLSVQTSIALQKKKKTQHSRRILWDVRAAYIDRRCVFY